MSAAKRTIPPLYAFPSIHDFPPFYTIQPTLSTRGKQLQLWCDIILQYCAATKTPSLSTSTTGPSPSSPSSPSGSAPSASAALFTNDKIRRRLDRDAITTIIDELVKQGNAEWDHPTKRDSCLVMWRKPEQWAAAVAKWAFETGATNSICTMYELLHGELTEGHDFHGLDERTMVKALEALAHDGKAQLFIGATDIEMGVKFF
ncbi:Vacuolar protein-sorting-associated protein 25 [Thoreauomyces humboldtii]|nr:Vacuolar protein-sorting-associated protein 25 [Thoreauomyces humboldtii]